MSLSRIQTGRTTLPPRLLLYGTEGIGKSTFGTTLPSPIFIPTEDGLGELAVAKYPVCTSLSDVAEALDDLARESHNYQSVVIDSVDWLEQIIWTHVCEKYRATSILAVDGGFGRGHDFAMTYWREVVAKLQRLCDRGMVVLMLAHSQVEKFSDPDFATFDRYSPRLHKSAMALISQWSDAVFFATRRMRTEDHKASFGATRSVAQPVGAAGGERIMRCAGGPTYLGKNRYGISTDLPLSWDAFTTEFARSRASV